MSEIKLQNTGLRLNVCKVPDITTLIGTIFELMVVSLKEGQWQNESHAIKGSRFKKARQNKCV